MSWANIFASIENILRLITMIGPLIDFVEMLFGKIFPGEKKGEEKKALTVELGRVVVGPEVTDEELSDLIEGYVKLKNRKGEFVHSNPIDDLGIGMP
jgi:hypothetical protein